jgi:hypothetical protein
MTHYLVATATGMTFAALKGNSNKEFTEKMALATKEEFSYDSVTPMGDIWKNGEDLIQEFKCIGDGFEETRTIRLSLTAIY